MNVWFVHRNRNTGEPQAYALVDVQETATKYIVRHVLHVVSATGVRFQFVAGDRFRKKPDPAIHTWELCAEPDEVILRILRERQAERERRLKVSLEAQTFADQQMVRRLR